MNRPSKPQKTASLHQELTRLTTRWHRDTVPCDEKRSLNFLCPFERIIEIPKWRVAEKPPRKNFSALRTEVFIQTWREIVSHVCRLPLALRFKGLGRTSRSRQTACSANSAA